MRLVDFIYQLKNLLPRTVRFSKWINELVELLGGFLQNLFSFSQAETSKFTKYAETEAFVHTIQDYINSELNSNIEIENQLVYIPLTLHQRIENKIVKLYQKIEGIDIYTIQINETSQPYNFIVTANGADEDLIKIQLADFLIAGTKFKII